MLSMNKKWTIKKVKEFARSKGFKILNKEYINIKTKMTFKCLKCQNEINRSFDSFLKNNICSQCQINTSKINRIKKQAKMLNLKISNKKELNKLYKNNQKITLVDENNYLFFLSIDNLTNSIRRNQRPRKFFSNNFYTYENIKRYIILNNINIDLLNNKDFILQANAKSKLLWKCKIHKNNFYKSWNCITRNQYCPLCGNEIYKEHKKNNYDDIKKGFEKIGYKLLSKKYINNQSPLKFVCPIHKENGVQEITWGNLIGGQRCRYCTKENFTKKFAKTHEEFNKEIKNIYKDKFIFLKEYKNNKTKVKLYCKDCKTEFYASPKHLINGHIG